MSDLERQRVFQARHPGYDRRRKARERAASKRYVMQLRRAATVAALIEAQAAEATPVVVATPVPVVTRLALPAPVVDPVIAELDALRQAVSSREREAVLVRPSADAGHGPRGGGPECGSHHKIPYPS